MKTCKERQGRWRHLLPISLTASPHSASPLTDYTEMQWGDATTPKALAAPVTKWPKDAAGKGLGPERLQPGGRAVGVFQPGKQKQTPLSAGRVQLSKGPRTPTRLLGAGVGGGVQSSSSPPQTARGEGLVPHGAAASLGCGESPSWQAWGGGGRHKPLCPSHF